MQERLNRLYEQYGYRKFKMSRFEDYDLYAQNRDFLRQDRIITFTDADGALKALKPDITLSIMKSNGGDSEKGVLQTRNVCREVGGAFREILQVGVESVGQIDPMPRQRSSPWPPAPWSSSPRSTCWLCLT